MSTSAIFLDIKKIFDKARQISLLYKLPELKLSISVIKHISSLIYQRKFRVSVDGEMSAARDIKAGVPQGSVLSPTLYSI
jgi:retron-type reverse transcriptase